MRSPRAKTVPRWCSRRARQTVNAQATVVGSRGTCCDRDVHSTLRACAFALVAAFVSGIGGCCGVGAVPNNDPGAPAHVTESGLVAFDPQAIGARVVYDIPVHETEAGTSETLLGADLVGDGKDAFTVVSSFPIAVPADEDVTVILPRG